MHRLLLRQIKRHLTPAQAADPLLTEFLTAVDAAYDAADSDRALVERSLELVSHELMDRNQRLAASAAELERSVRARTAELIAAQERYQSLIERSPWIVYVADADVSAGLRYASPQVAKMLGYAHDRWIERSFRLSTIHVDDRPAFLAEAARALEAGDAFRCEYRVHAVDGQERWVRDEAVPILDPEAACGVGATLMHGVIFDITERKSAEERVRHDALHDALTGLPNRTLFLDRLERAMARLRRTGGPTFAVLFLDLDRFKIINDSIGHACGDELLVQFAARLADCLRDTDSMARLGGDEFTILADNITELAEVEALAERIHAALRSPFAIGGHEVFTSSSIGIAMATTGYAAPEDLVRDADTAMYKAKALGPSRHQVFDEKMHAQALKVLQLENDLRRAVDRDEFSVHYQPIVSLLTGRIEGLEALIRWKHPERGWVSPADFIPRAEETGLITRIGQFVLRQACRDAAAWRATLGDDDAPTVSVNLSAKQFTGADLVGSIQSALQSVALPPHFLRLEITESTIMQSGEASEAQAMLQRLQDTGVRIDVDDFGTGYSSLGYLHRFPIDKLKIDRSFVENLRAPAGAGSNSPNAVLPPTDADALVHTIITLAHSLRLQVTAEGVETYEQAQRLHALDCDSAQGYVFSRPIPAADVLTLLRTWSSWNPQQTQRAAG